MTHTRFTLSPPHPIPTVASLVANTWPVFPIEQFIFFFFRPPAYLPPPHRSVISSPHLSRSTQYGSQSTSSSRIKASVTHLHLQPSPGKRRRVAYRGGKVSFFFSLSTIFFEGSGGFCIVKRARVCMYIYLAVSILLEDGLGRNPRLFDE